MILMLTAFLVVISGVSLAVFMNFPFIRTLWNDNTANIYRDSISESAIDNYTSYNFATKIFINEN